MIIRNYTNSDESQWLKCRLLSFYDSSYCDDILHKKVQYENETIDLVAEIDNVIVGFLEIEIEKKPKDVCYLDGDLGGNIWNIGVLPEYRNKNIATLLLDEAKGIALKKGITRLEAWTQDDEDANRWYIHKGFRYIEGYLNVFVSGVQCNKDNLITDKIGEIFGIRRLNFEAKLSRKQEISDKGYKFHEVKLFELKF